METVFFSRWQDRHGNHGGDNHLIAVNDLPQWFIQCPGYSLPKLAALLRLLEEPQVTIHVQDGLEVLSRPQPAVLRAAFPALYTRFNSDRVQFQHLGEEPWQATYLVDGQHPIDVVFGRKGTYRFEGTQISQPWTFPDETEQRILLLSTNNQVVVRPADWSY